MRRNKEINKTFECTGVRFVEVRRDGRLTSELLLFFDYFYHFLFVQLLNLLVTRPRNSSRHNFVKLALCKFKSFDEWKHSFIFRDSFIDWNIKLNVRNESHMPTALYARTGGKRKIKSHVTLNLIVLQRFVNYLFASNKRDFHLKL